MKRWAPRLLMIEGGPQLRDRLAPDLITARFMFFSNFKLCCCHSALSICCCQDAGAKAHTLTGRMAAGAAVLDLTVDDDAANVGVTVAPGASYMSAAQERASIG